MFVYRLNLDMNNHVWAIVLSSLKLHLTIPLLDYVRVWFVLITECSHQSSSSVIWPAIGSCNSPWFPFYWDRWSDLMLIAITFFNNMAGYVVVHTPKQSMTVTNETSHTTHLSLYKVEGKWPELHWSTEAAGNSHFIFRLLSHFIT